MFHRLPSIGDDNQLFRLWRDMSGGMNTRQHESVIGDDQAKNLTNVILDTKGERSIRPGCSMFCSLASTPGYGLFGWNNESGSNYLAAAVDTTFRMIDTTGSVVSLASIPVLTASKLTTFLKAGESGEGDILVFGNGTENWFRVDQSLEIEDLGNTSGTGSDSPPRSQVGLYYRNRLWILKDNELYFSDAYPTTYSNTFDTNTNTFRFPVGDEMGLVGMRDSGIVVFGRDQIWALNPSAVPDPSTDKPEPLLTNLGCVSKGSIKAVGDDIYFMAPDGIRGLFRTVQDKLQVGRSIPLSYPLQDQFNEINWNSIDKADAIYWDNKYFLTLTTGVSSTNNSVWVYYPAFEAWVVFSGLAITKFATMSVANEERLYGITTSGEVWRLMTGTSDNGTAITFTEESKSIDFEQPLIDKQGGEFKVLCEGGNGTLVVSASANTQDYTQLGTIDLSITGVTFPTTFPVNFVDTTEVRGTFHLDQLGEFRRIKFKLYCTSLDAVVKILQTEAITFVNQYQSEEE